MAPFEGAILFVSAGNVAGLRDRLWHLLGNQIFVEMDRRFQG